MKQQSQSFETIVAELETIVTDLEQSIGIEEALKKYQTGMALARQAETRLKEIENQFEKLQIEFSSSESEKNEGTLPVEEPPSVSSSGELDSLPF